MKVSKLMSLLEKCSPDADVSVVYGEDNLLDGCEVTDVIEITFHKDCFVNSVVLRA